MSGSRAGPVSSHCTQAPHVLPNLASHASDSESRTSDVRASSTMPNAFGFRSNNSKQSFKPKIFLKSGHQDAFFKAWNMFIELFLAPVSEPKSSFVDTSPNSFSKAC